MRVREIILFHIHTPSSTPTKISILFFFSFLPKSVRVFSQTRLLIKSVLFANAYTILVIKPWIRSALNGGNCSIRVKTFALNDRTTATRNSFGLIYLKFRPEMICRSLTLLEWDADEYIRHHGKEYQCRNDRKNLLHWYYYIANIATIRDEFFAGSHHELKI